MGDRRLRLRFAAFLVVLLVIGGSPCGLLAQPEIPPLTERVMDLADVLSTTTEREIVNMLATHESQTGNQVAVLTIPSLQGASVEEFALDVARSWELGTAENDNGVLFLLAIQDREMRIEVGFGLEGALPDVVADRILRNDVRPLLRQGDFDAGVAAGVRGIIGAIEGTYEPPERSGDKPPFWFGILFMLIPSLFIIPGVFSPGFMRWFLMLFLCPFFFAAGMMITGGFIGGLVAVGIYLLIFLGVSLHPGVRAVRAKVKKGEEVKWAGMTFSGGSSGGWSSGGSSWSSSSSGGFSGGGGSFGGGGASSSW